MAALATWAPDDRVLGLVAPLGLAAAAGTALVVDLAGGGLRPEGVLSLAELAAEGPRARDLHPGSVRGVAVLAGDGPPDDAGLALLAVLVEKWPAVVLRVGDPAPVAGAPVVPVLPLLPGEDGRRGPAVYQQTAWRMDLPGPGVLLPRPGRPVWRALLEGRVPRTDRWMRAWGDVWRFSWA